MSIPVETQAPPSPPADLSIDEIVTAALAEAEKAGTPVVASDAAETAPAAEAKTDENAASQPAQAPETKGNDAAGDEDTVPDVSAARARKILEQVESRRADLDAREARLAEQARDVAQSVVAELLRAPKATLAKYGKHIDDVIDASVNEGKGGEAAAAEDDNPRLTALEKRIEAREQAEEIARNQAAIDAKVSGIQRDIKASAKFPLINELDAASDVTDFMLAHWNTHGKPISWERAAALVESDLKARGERVARKLGYQPPAAAANPAEAPAARAGTTSIGGSQRDAAPTSEELPDDPEKLMQFLVTRATSGLLKSV